MNKQEFVDRLRMALNGRVSPGLVMDNVNYYQDYINTEIRKGRTEEEVLESLGDPQTDRPHNHSDQRWRQPFRIPEHGLRETESIRGRLPDRMSIVVIQRKRMATEHQSKVEMFWRSFRAGWLILGILVVVLIFGAVFSVLSFLAPVLIPIVVVLFLVKLFRDWLN